MLAQLQQQIIFELTQKNGCRADSYAKSLALLAAHHLSPSEQLDIYNSSILSSLNNTLKKIYAVCAHLMGHKHFAHTTEKYIATQASSSPDLNLYGEKFPLFIEKTVTVNHLKCLADIARIEWSWNTAYDSADESAPPIAEQIARLEDSEFLDIIFCLPTAATLISSHHPVLDIWNTCHRQYATTSKPFGKHKTYLIIHRHELNTKIDQLSKLEFDFLHLIRAEKTLGEIVETLNNTSSDFSLNTLLLNANHKGWLFTIK